MIDFLLLAVINRLWYALPLIVSVSLVYAATRHEMMRPILQHAFRTIVFICVFMAVVFGILYFIDSFFLRR